ncbi:MAG: ribulose-phosphate 3-epimerase [candidate division NC10 bacterium]|nr:ribulose-phosphate 3-epimerase [candidate division NC10 bacterium]
MKLRVKIAPSILSADFASLAEEVARVEGEADLLHLDVMDGHFVPNLTFGPPLVSALRKRTRLPFDVHLMVSDPDRFLLPFAEAGADFLTVHVEACPHLHRTLQRIKELGKKAGVSLNPSTPLSAIEWVKGEVDLVLLMSVNPGWGGQSFIPSTLRKIRELAEMAGKDSLSFELEVDGGIQANNCKEVAEAGATLLVAGSFVFGSANPAEAIRQMKERLR